MENLGQCYGPHGAEGVDLLLPGGSVRGPEALHLQNGQYLGFRLQDFNQEVRFGSNIPRRS
eukprot:1615138-Amphidinium_carterae.1